jgi:hypothetical protein
MPKNVKVKSKEVPGFGEGWITYASWDNNTRNPISSFKTTWLVPPPPSTQSDQTIFLFNGIQNSDWIYQPVLQWGTSAAGGGNYWSIASWYVDGSDGPETTALFTDLVRVTPGDTLVGVMALTRQNGNLFDYNCFFQGIANTSLVITDVEQLTWCAETLEAYGITNCSNYPNTDKTAMTAIDIQTGNVRPTLAWSADNSVTDCGQETVVVSNSARTGEVNLYYHR